MKAMIFMPGPIGALKRIDLTRPLDESSPGPGLSLGHYKYRLPGHSKQIFVTVDQTDESTHHGDIGRIQLTHRNFMRSVMAVDRRSRFHAEGLGLSQKMRPGLYP